MEIVLILILILLNGLFALSEIALVSVKQNKIEYKARNGNRNAQIVKELLQQPENFLSSIQVGITLIGIVSGAYGGAALADDLEPFVAGIPLFSAYASSISIAIIVGAITYLSIVIGELIPKSIGMNNAESIALMVGPFIKYFSKAAYPVVRLLSFSTKALLKLLGIKKKSEDSLTEEELRHMIRLAGTEGVIEREESQMHQNIFFFSNLKAKNLMTHRSAVEWIDVRDSVDQITQQFQKSNFSKFPASAGELDNIRGIITAKKFYEKRFQADFKIETVLEKPLVIPEAMLAIDILRLFRQHKQYLAIVVDEFGSFEGIVTLHDLIEPILGDLPNIGEEEGDAFVQRAEGSYLVSGAISVHQFNAHLGYEVITERPDHYTTLGGFIIFFLHKIPDTGEKFTYKNYSFEVVDLDGRRIDKVLVQQQKELIGSNID